MKLSFKTILPIILISALLILLTGCAGVTPDESPGYTPGTITGIIAAPCCDQNSVEAAEGDTTSPEYWCYFCRETWNLQKGIEVVLTYGEHEVATTTTNDKGEFTFTNVDPGKNYVITAYCPEFTDNRPLVKDVALQLIEGGSFDTNITDLVSTSLGLVVDFLVTYTELTPEDIVLDDVIAANPNFIGFPKFKTLVLTVRNVLESCGNVDTDEDVQDALCLAAEEIGRKVLPDLDLGCAPGFTPATPNPPPPPPPPPPGPCAGNVAPSISSVLLDSTAVIINQTVHVVVGTPYVVTVNASDDGIADPLTYSATIEGTPVGSVASNVITVTPLVVGTFEVFVNVNDGCTTTAWGPVTVVVDPTYNVYYDGNTNTSGTVPVDANNYVAGTSVTVLGNSGSLAKAANYTFTGWNTAANGSGTAYDPAAIFSMPAFDVTLYAQWGEDTKYSVTYNLNGGTSGSQTDGSSPYYAGDEVTVLNQGSMVKTDYHFTGWNTAANGSGTAYDPAAIFSMPAFDVTLYAQWGEDTKYSVTYNLNGGTSGSQTDGSSPYYAGDEVTVLNQGSMARDRYNFTGWKNGGGTDYAAGDKFNMPAANAVSYT